MALSEGSQAGRSLTLDSVRGIAILLAMGWHLQTQTGIAALDLIQWPQVQFGWIGVDLFFVLSGFLVGRLILLELNDAGTFDYRRFLIRRIFRLWPVLYLYIFAQLVVGNKPASEFFWQVLFHVQNYFHTPLKVLWSLAVEEHFYLAVGLILPWLARRGTDKQTYAAGLLGVILLSPVVRIAGVEAGYSNLDLQTFTHFRVDGLAAGVLLALVSLEWPEKFAKIARPHGLYLVLTVVCYVLAGWWHETALGNTLGYSLGVLGSVALVLAFVNWNPPSMSIWIFRVLAWLGIYSYSIYIWHFPFANYGEIALRKIGVDTLWQLLFAKYVLAIFCSVAISKLVEMPMIRLRNRLFPTGVHAIESRPGSS